MFGEVLCDVCAATLVEDIIFDFTVGDDICGEGSVFGDILVGVERRDLYIRVCVEAGFDAT